MSFYEKLKSITFDDTFHYGDEEIYIRPITFDDTDNIIKWRNSDAIRCHFIYQGLFTKESHENWLNNQVAVCKVAQFIICLKNGDVPVGSVYIRDIDFDKAYGEYGIFIGEASARGRGIGSRTAKLMTKLALEELSFKGLFLRVFEDNVAAVKSYENAGFKLNGKSEILDINGTKRKVVFMELK